MKIICKDNYNREYRPERLITVSISEIEAKVIVDILNTKIGGESSENHYVMVEDDYKLNLESMYDCNGEEPPKSFYIEQYGLEALFNISNMEYYKKSI